MVWLPGPTPPGTLRNSQLKLEVVWAGRLSTWTVMGTVLLHGENWMLNTAGNVWGGHVG